ncbi:hypothetical protein Q764_07715 [Flavobacterium suncheonense GH29-5 = DSM 17707]|uniref:Acyltransferase 3 domain-containing protein n=1 Tax=Flavobacterium suncheonense GH29-5 = DSM 17707 TaxID=1121899 RepID=A0A0A2MBL8_9FLAO|nr:hypothetical protein Q764_07715 [Flavobacterium suncheonense GH29-5 = DSM 17707]
MFSHLYYLIGSQNPVLISLSGLFGYAGVELFFVLSGFLIGTLLLKMFVKDFVTPSDLFRFFKRRWFRTLPLYYVALLLNVAIAFAFGYSKEGIWRYFLFVQNFNKDYITFFPESWSLSVEEWAYLLLPVLLFIGWQLFKKQPKSSFLVTSLLVILALHWLRYHHYLNHRTTDMTVWNAEVKSVVIFRIDAIAVGFIVAWAHFYYEAVLRKIAVYGFIVAAHLFLLQFLVLNVMSVDIFSAPVYFHVFYFTLTSFTFALALPFFIFWKSSATVMGKMITVMSKISYAAYLIHYCIMSALLKYLMSYLGWTLSSFPLILIYLFLTLAVSYLLHRYFEKPIMDMRDRW